MGDRRAHLAHALRRLAEETTLTGVSSVYETDPVGFADQPPFLNMVARVETPLKPAALLELTRRIEAERGRERTFRNAPRTLDLDLLLHGDVVVDEPGLTVPHPRMTDRAFVLMPLLELDPERVDPRTGRRLADLPASRSGRGIRRVCAGEDLLETG